MVYVVRQRKPCFRKHVIFPFLPSFGGFPIICSGQARVLASTCEDFWVKNIVRYQNVTPLATDFMCDKRTQRGWSAHTMFHFRFKYRSVCIDISVSSEMWLESRIHSQCYASFMEFAINIVHKLLLFLFYFHKYPIPVQRAKQGKLFNAFFLQHAWHTHPTPQFPIIMFIAVFFGTPH